VIRAVIHTNVLVSGLLSPAGNEALVLLAIHQGLVRPCSEENPRRRDSAQDEDALIGCALHQHKLHLSEVYGLRRDQAGRILLKNDGLVFHEGE
jgi:hypothetical protein